MLTLDEVRRIASETAPAWAPEYILVYQTSPGDIHVWVTFGACATANGPETRVGVRWMVSLATGEVWGGSPTCLENALRAAIAEKNLS